MRLRAIAHARIQETWLRRGFLLAFATVIAMAAGVHVAGAVKSPPPPPNPDNPYAGDKVVPREIERQMREREERDARRKTDAAKQQRRESRTKYRDKSKREALEIARAKFDKLIGAPAWAGLRLRAGEKVKRYVDDHQALLDVGDGDGDLALVVSELPLLNEQGEPTDLALEPKGDGFAPTAPAVDLALPGNLADGVSVDGGRLRITPATDAPTEATAVEDKVFYANALTDTDVLVAPTAAGLETFHQLRSAESPERLAFDVEVPGDATLRQAAVEGPDPAQRGLEVVSPGGRKIATISPPRALAADGAPVAVNYSIDGDRVTMHVPHRDEDVAYPIMVDPDHQLEDFKHWATGNRDTFGWRFGSWGNCGWNGFFGQAWWTYGHTQYQNSGWWCNDGEWSEWKWIAPGMSYIYRAEHHYINHPWRYSCVVSALWAQWSNRWDGDPWVYCGDLWNHAHGHCPVAFNCDPNNGEASNVAVFKLQAWGSGPRNPGAYAELGGAALYLRDRENPVIESTGQTTDGRWYRAGAGTAYVRPRAHDDGLGMNKFQLIVPGKTDEYRRHNCIRSRCPRSWSLPDNSQPEGGDFGFSIDALPNGRNPITLNARDALDKITGSSWYVSVDREQPWLNVYGELRDAVYDGTWSGARTLSINSTDGVNPHDGNPATARAGVTAVDIYVDEVKRHSQTQSCYSNCRLDFDWTMYAGDYSAGAHNIRVVARDGAGNERSSSTWKVYTTPSGLVMEDKDPEPDDGSAPDITAASLGTKCLDTNRYCGQNDATNPAHNEAAAEGPLSTSDPFGNPTTAPEARDRWGYAGIRGDDFDRPFLRRLFDRPGAKRARVIVPWDILLRAEGVQRYPGTTNPERVPPTYGWYAGSIGGTKTWDERTLRQLNPKPLEQYDRFMERANAYGWEVMISFGSTDEVITYRGDTKYKLGSRVLPRTYDANNPNDPYGYLYNVKRLLERWRTWYPNLRIQHLSAWNEPNHDAYSPSGRLSFPHLGDASKPKYITQDQMREGAKYAAAYYNELDNYCGKTQSCQVLAGEFVDRKDMTRYFPHYVGFLNRRPPRWAFHPYLAGARGIRDYPNWDGVFKWFNNETNNAEGGPHPQIWFTEVGPLYSGSNGNPDYSKGVDQLTYQMRLTLKSRVTRFYYYSAYGGYELKGNPPRNDIHDSGFIDPAKDQRNADGTWRYPYEADRIRPAWCTYGRKTNPDVFSQPFPRWDGANRGDGTIDGWRACP